LFSSFAIFSKKRWFKFRLNKLCEDRWEGGKWLIEQGIAFQEGEESIMNFMRKKGKMLRREKK